HFRRTYPMLADVPVEGSWTGPIDRSRTGLPFFGELPGMPGVLVGVGYSGNGVGPSYLGGRMLASLALGRDDEWSNAGLVGPPGGELDGHADGRALAGCGHGRGAPDRPDDRFPAPQRGPPDGGRVRHRGHRVPGDPVAGAPRGELSPVR